MYKRILALCAALLFSLGARAQLVLGQENKVDFGEFEKIFRKDFEEGGAPGAAVAIISGDRLIYAKTLGVASVETGAPVTSDTLFLVGATTRLFTSAALLGLAEDEKKSLDEPLGNYIKGLNPKVSQVTIGQLLSQTAGIKNERYKYGSHDDKELERYVQAISDDYFFTKPGEIFSTSSPSYAIAAYAAESLGRKPFADVVRERVFKRIGMHRSTFRPDIAMTYPIAQAHEVSGVSSPVVVRPFVDHVVFRADTIMYSSINDLAGFAIAFLNGGKVEGRQILSPSVIAKMSTPITDLQSVGNLAEAKYGYGMLQYDYRGIHFLEDDSVTLGYTSRFRMAPEHRFAIIILANSNVGGFYRTVDKAYELLLPVTPSPAPQPAPVLHSDESEMRKYVGKYVNPPDDIDIALKDGKLFFKQIGIELPMVKIGDRVFQIQPPSYARPIELKMVAGKDGKVEYMCSSFRAFKKVQ